MKLMIIGGTIRVWRDLDRNYDIDQLEAKQRRNERNGDDH